MGNALSYKSLEGRGRPRNRNSDAVLENRPLKLNTESHRSPGGGAEHPEHAGSVDGRRECARRRAIGSACVPSAEATRNARLFVGLQASSDLLGTSRPKRSRARVPDAPETSRNTAGESEDERVDRRVVSRPTWLRHTRHMLVNLSTAELPLSGCVCCRISVEHAISALPCRLRPSGGSARRITTVLALGPFTAHQRAEAPVAPSPDSASRKSVQRSDSFASGWDAIIVRGTSPSLWRSV